MASRGQRQRPWSLHLLVGALCALVLWAPLPFGSIVGWGQTTLQVATALLLAFALFAAETSVPHRAGLGAAALVVVAALGLIQAHPWPIGVVKIVSPQHAVLAERADELGTESPNLDRVPLSLAPAASRSAALTWFAVAAALASASVLARDRKHRRWLAITVVASAVAQLLAGVSWMSSRNDWIWGVAVAGDANRLRGTFVNSDHLAEYFEIALAVAFAWGWWAWRRVREVHRWERRILLVVPPSILWVTLFVGLAFTGSRAGLAAGVVGVLLQGALVAMRGRRWRLGVVGAAAAALGLGAVAAIGLQQGLGRWLATSQYDLTWNQRLAVYSATIDLWERFPWLGTGLATFREGYSLVDPGGAAAQVSFWHAHNDFLEILATVGVVGLGLVLLAGGAAVGGIVRRLRNGNRSEDRAAALAALGALAALAIHECLDFGLSMPANALTLAVVVGAALAVPLGGRQDGEEEDSGVSRRVRLNGVTRPPVRGTTSR